MKLLMHICCAPCANMPIDALRADGIDLTGYWYNPNIHPFTEYRARRNCLQEYAKTIELPLLMRDDYGLRPFVREVAGDIAGRCVKCTGREGGRVRRVYVVSVHQPLSEARADARRGLPRGGGIRRGILLSGFPPHVPRRPGPCAGAGLLHAEILRLHLLRAGTLSKAQPDHPVRQISTCLPYGASE